MHKMQARTMGPAAGSHGGEVGIFTHIRDPCESLQVRRFVATPWWAYMNGWGPIDGSDAAFTTWNLLRLSGTRVFRPTIGPRPQEPGGLDDIRDRRQPFTEHWYLPTNFSRAHP
jgi:hypothetical protein